MTHKIKNNSLNQHKKWKIKAILTQIGFKYRTKGSKKVFTILRKICKIFQKNF